MTLDEQRSLFTYSALRNKVATACVNYAESLLTGTPTADQLALVNSIIDNPGRWGEKITMIVLAANTGLTVSQVQSATDAAIQTNVNDALQYFADAGLL